MAPHAPPDAGLFNLSLGKSNDTAKRPPETAILNLSLLRPGLGPGGKMVFPFIIFLVEPLRKS